MLLNHVAMLESVYQRLPVWLQNVALSGFGYHVKMTRYNSEFYRSLHAMQERDSWPAEKVQAFLDEQVARFVRHAAETVPYYRDLFRREGLDHREIASVEDLCKLPVLRKSTVQERVADFVSEAIPKPQLIRVETSGSTGAGLPVFATMQALRDQWAVWWRHRLRHGIEPGTPCVIFRGLALFPAEQSEPPYWRYNRAERQIYVNGNQINEKSFPSILEEFNRRRVPWFHGYPSAISALAALMLEHGRRLDYQVRRISMSSEQVLDHQLEAMEKAFGVRPTHHYGMVEAVANISQDPDGVSYVDEDFAPVELIPTEASGRFGIVGTNITNPAFPLIRYQMDDVAQASGEKDGRGRRIIDGVLGRKDDYVVTANGSRIGRLDFLFVGNVNVREAQIVQHRIGHITVRIVRGHRYTAADEAQILAAAHKRLSEDTSIEFEYVPAIEKGPSGKLRHVISHLSEGQL